MRSVIASYKLIFIILLNVVFPFLLSGSDVRQEHDDKIWQNIRLHAHLLVNPSDLNETQLGAIRQRQLPVAFFASGSNTDIIKKLMPGLPQPDSLLVLVTDDDLSIPGTVVIKPTEADWLDLPGDFENHREKLSCNEFLHVNISADSLPADSLIMDLWSRSGKMPNFIQVKPTLVDSCISLVSRLNQLQIIFGVIRDNGNLLSDVSWKDQPERKANGYFCFPVRWSGAMPLAPYKAGYQFSPDIVLPSPENLKNLKVFNAVKLDPDFGLTDQFVFASKTRNLTRGNDDEIIPYNTSFARDNEKGKCAFFSGKAYVDGGLKSRAALKPNFSITAWIKPTELGQNNCILGKGRDFVLKIHEGELTFTVQGVKDYHSVKTRIPLNQWSFIGLVHSGSENVISFYLNGELTEKIKLLTAYVGSDYTMLIGSNLWEEFFVGYMKEIKIWDRELNAEEIVKQFQDESESRQIFFSGIIWIFPFLLILMVLIVRKKHKKQLASTVIHPSANKVKNLFIPDETGNMKEQICCFGGLKVIDSEGKDISKKFSPKLKQLFVLILLHSLGDQKGISSKEMSDLLWPGMSPQNAKNIRGTNIQNLKLLLSTCYEFKLVFKDKLWLLEFEEGYFVDFALVEDWLNNAEKNDFPDTLKQLPKILALLKKGTLFPNMGESWLDAVIDRTSNRIVEYGQQLCQILTDEKLDNLVYEIAEVISINDPLNEPAMRKKINILTRQGKLGLAHTVFDNFVKLYFELYREKYPADFKTMISAEGL